MKELLAIRPASCVDSRKKKALYGYDPLLLSQMGI